MTFGFRQLLGRFRLHRWHTERSLSRRGEGRPALIAPWGPSCPDKSAAAEEFIVFLVRRYHSLEEGIPLLPLRHTRPPTHSHQCAHTYRKHFALVIWVWFLLCKQERKGAGVMTASVNMNPRLSRPPVCELIKCSWWWGKLHEPPTTSNELLMSVFQQGPLPSRVHLHHSELTQITQRMRIISVGSIIHKRDDRACLLHLDMPDIISTVAPWWVMCCTK